MSIPLRCRRGCNGARAIAPRATGTTVAIPTALKVGDTYLIFSEVTYKYVPTVGYVHGQDRDQPERLHLSPVRASRSA